LAPRALAAYNDWTFRHRRAEGERKTARVVRGLLLNRLAIGYAIGKLLQVMGCVLIIPFCLDVYHHFSLPFVQFVAIPEVFGFIAAIILSILLGTILTTICYSSRDLQGVREGFAIVTLGWIALALVGCIPFFTYFLGSEDPLSAIKVGRCFTDAYFEIMSGFTTTGATIIANIEGLPRSLLFWRSLTHWLGGMGIITLALAIFPAMGVSGYQMFRGEVPGPSAERLQPRLAETAKILWGVYLLLSVVETILLFAGGMSLFDSLCHTFGTMATGGFSTRNASIGAYNSNYIDWVVTVFMFLAGMNFLIHYRVLRGKYDDLFVNREFRFYAVTICACTICVTAILYYSGLPPADDAAGPFCHDAPVMEEFSGHIAAESAKLDSLYQCFRKAAFQVVAITTTTGYGTANFDLWPDICRFLLVVLMFCGGCAGSTGGGMKMVRIMVVLKTAGRELRKMSKPRLIAPLKIGDAAVNESTVINIAAFFILFMTLFVASALLLTLFVPDLVTAVTAAAATIGNIGPGLAGVGPTEHYGWIPCPGKWILIFCMLLGRLEIFTVLIAFNPATWKS
jgi:trk system potassium uptake protein TrkH